MKLLKPLTPRREQIRLWLSSRQNHSQQEVSLQAIIEEAQEFPLPDEPDEFGNTCKRVSEDPEDTATRLVHPVPPIKFFTRESRDAVAKSWGFLPHWSHQGSTYFITLCLADRWTRCLGTPQAAQIVEEAFAYGDGRDYHLDAYVVMADHVHMLLELYSHKDVKVFQRDLKRFMARQINKILRRQGQLWQYEHFDHIVRNQRYWVKFFDYIHNNPVKARLVTRAEDFCYSSLQKLYGVSLGEGLWGQGQGRGQLEDKLGYVGNATSC